MSELKVTIEERSTEQQDSVKEAQAKAKLDWETPRMEDVSEQVMAQPYIRFT
jgi:hypothetical protein